MSSPGMRLAVCASLVLAAAQLGFAQPSANPDPNGLSPRAQEQLGQIYLEKETRTAAQKKLATALVYEVRAQAKDRVMEGLPRLPYPFTQDKSRRLEVDLEADVTPELLQAIRDADGVVVNQIPQYRAVRAYLSLGAIAEIAERDEVHHIRPADKPFLSSVVDKKTNTSQGDVAHAANLARALYGVTGAGIKVGVISDSVDALATVQGTGDLPAVTVLTGQSGNPGSSEGTAMLEIVYDLAPGAQLHFATANGGEAQFATNIQALAAAGCKVIVDDVGYFGEGVFQDDVIAQAVNTVTGAGVAYFSSAGNSGRADASTAGVWEGNYSASSTVLTVTSGPSLVTKGRLHDFGGGVLYNSITQAASSASSPITFWWSDALGASSNDYDLCLFNSSHTSVFGCSNDTQDGNDDPFEALSGPQVSGTALAIVNYDSTSGQTSPQAARFFHLDLNRGRLSKATSGSTWGHSAAANAFSIAAVNVATAGGGVFVGGGTNPIETFSSDGPRKIFYNANGSAITPGNYLSSGGTSRQKPDLAAGDGVACATSGFNPFFGTSAAAPHAAAIAALMYDANSGLSLAALRTALISTALDVNPAGVDRNAGYGLIDAVDAVGAVYSGGPSTCVRDADTACLNSSRFEVEVTYTNTSGSGNAQVMYFNSERAENNESAFFFFTGSSNFEMGVKVLNACIPLLGNKYWVFVSGLTDQGWTVTVTDTANGTVKTYSNPNGQLSETFADTSAFATCP